MPRVSAREAQRAIERDGWVWNGGTGSHRQFGHPTKRGRVTIAFHGPATTKPDTLKRIIQQAGLTIQDFIDLL